MKTITDFQKIEQVLKRGVEKIYPTEDSLKNVLLSGKRIKLYCGYDPTAPTLHLGHLITLKKLRQFQELGHEVIMLIGDFTGMIGDPTDKSSARKKLTRKEVLFNAKNYKNLTSKFLDFNGKNPAKILFNSEWSSKLSFGDLIELASNFTVQQTLVRDFFQERMNAKKPIFLHEFLYPLAQAYDSVAMNVDLEIGGNDQTFNMLCGRDLMKNLKNKEKFVMALKLLVGPEGKKMGKTEGNLVALDAGSNEIFGKIMSWSDDLIIPGLELLTNVADLEIKEITEKINLQKINPKEIKIILAKEIVKICHDEKKAIIAQEEFDSIHKEKNIPSDISVFQIKSEKISILDILVETKLAVSKSEAKRLVIQGGVKIDGVVQTDWQKVVEINKFVSSASAAKIKNGLIIQVGNRKFAKISN